MTSLIARRRFLRQSAVAATTLAAGPALLRAAGSPNSRLVVGVMGLGRGADHIRALLQIPHIHIGYVCDVDSGRLAAAAKLVAATQAEPAKAVGDFREALADKAVDAMTIATPNFWHAPATILACAAGKHVYVEKPGSHNAREGELMVAAARKHQRVVQMGAQRRSWPGIREAIEKLRGGVIGRVLFARTYYTAARPSIGRGKPVPVPATLDYSLWQGPAPERLYVDNLVPYNWHWRWHWGGGELANNGVHALDLARWGLGVEFPRRISCTGGRYHYSDDQETPDTAITTFDFGSCGATFDHSSCSQRKPEDPPFVSFYGEQGSLALLGAGYKVYDPKGQVIGQGTGESGDKVHFQNFLDCVRAGSKPNAEIEEGQKSALLCHLGNIAYRVGRTLQFDAATRKIKGDPEAEALWGREYRSGWEPKV